MIVDLIYFIEINMKINNNNIKTSQLFSYIERIGKICQGNKLKKLKIQMLKAF